MCEEVEHTGSWAIHGTRYAQADEHVSQLANGRESQHPLEVGLHQGNRGGKNRSNASNPGHDLERRRVGSRKKWEGARYHIHARCDHRSRVDQRADGCRAFHRRWQPDLQWYLRRFTYCAAEDQDHGGCQHSLVHVRNRCRQLAEIKGTRVGEQDHDADDKADIAHAVRNKGLNGCARRRKTVFLWLGSLVAPEADQQVRTETHQFPPDEDHQEVLGKNNHQHGKGEECKVGEEARIPRRIFHVALRVELYEQRDAGDHNHHGDCQVIQVKANVVATQALTETILTPPEGDLRERNALAWQRRGDRKYPCSVEQQDPGINTGQAHDQDADVATYPGPGRQARNFGVFNILKDDVFATRPLLMHEMNIALFLCFSDLFMPRSSRYALARGQVPHACAENNHRECEKR